MDDRVYTSLDLRESIYALSDALDLVGIDEVQHGKRVAFIAVTIARAIGLGSETVSNLLYAGLLHDCGVSSTKVHKCLVNELEWSQAEVHCKTGYKLIKAFEPLSFLAPIILHHHTRWESLGKAGLSAEDALLANLLFLADRVDALFATNHKGNLHDTQALVRKTIASFRETLFSPRLVDSFLSLSEGEAFWLALDPIHILNFLWSEEKKQSPWPIDVAQFKQLARVFGTIVDAKSRFTLEHSRGVAQLARYLGEKLNLSPATCDKLEIAGFLHDLGKLQIPDDILEKPAVLDDQERDLINRHSFESYQVLKRISGLQDVALWAAYHHESPSGSGYPFHIQGSALGLEARIIGVADVFQALAQDRPYRKALAPEIIMGMLWDLASSQRLDHDLVTLVSTDLQGCWQAALSPEKLYQSV